MPKGYDQAGRAASIECLYETAELPVLSHTVLVFDSVRNLYALFNLMTLASRSFPIRSETPSTVLLHCTPTNRYLIQKKNCERIELEDPDAGSSQAVFPKGQNMFLRHKCKLPRGVWLLGSP